MDTGPSTPDPGGPRRDFAAPTSEPGPPSFEWLLGRLGAGGRRQRLLLALSCLPCLLLGLGVGSDALFTLTPPRHCRDANGTRVPENATCQDAHCPNWDYGGLPALTSNPVTEWFLDCSRGWVVPLEQLCFLLGFAAGALFLGHLADSVGRRSTLLLALALGCPAGILAAFAASPSVFMLGRCLWGVMLGGMELALYLSRLELCCPSQRLPVAMAGDLLMVGGHFLLLGLALACGSWRILQGVISAGLGLCLLYGCPGFYPESPRWLLATRRTAQAKEILMGLTQGGAAQESEAQEALAELDNACHLPAAAQISLRLLLSCRNIWKNILILGFTTFIAHAICHCYRLAWESPEDPHATFYLSYLLSTGSAGLACLFLCLSVDRYGRRGILLLTTTLTGIASLILLGLGEYLNSAAQRTFSILGLFASHAAGSLSVFFASEVIPTVIREQIKSTTSQPHLKGALNSRCLQRVLSLKKWFHRLHKTASSCISIRANAKLITPLCFRPLRPFSPAQPPTSLPGSSYPIANLSSSQPTNWSLWGTPCPAWRPRQRCARGWGQPVAPCARL